MFLQDFEDLIGMMKKIRVSGKNHQYNLLKRGLIKRSVKYFISNLERSYLTLPKVTYHKIGFLAMRTR